jgi:hypothetical protein
VAGCCECGDEPSDYCTMELVLEVLASRKWWLAEMTCSLILLEP